MMDAEADVKQAIRARGASMGFDAIGFAAAAARPEDQAALARFLKLGRQGDMDWLARTAAMRGDPQALWPAAKSVIALGLNYGPRTDPLAPLALKTRGAISVYAHGRDYHAVLKKRLKRLAGWIAETYAAEVKVFVDTAPVMEKPLAERAGIGWQGKHTNLVSRAFGSWLFLGEVLTTLEIAPDAPEADHCGSCDRCRQACPTAALPEPYRIDPGRCVSYLTIEHKGGIDPLLMALMGNRVYGCDDCLAVCPWNKFGVPTGEPDLLPRTRLSAPMLADLARLDDAAFRAMFQGSPIKRTGRDRFVRNVMIAIGNSADASLRPVAERLLADPSGLVREAAAWAEERLREAATAEA